MSNDLPTLIVDERQMGYLTGDHPADIEHTVRIDGDLPTVEVWDAEPGHEMWSTRPLRTGDRVTLATIEVERDETSGGEWPLGTVPFATATVTDIDPWSYMDRDDHGYHITVSDVEAL